MANLTDERLKEMEEEMNRFEEEILANGEVVTVPSKMIIGTRTFRNVEAQLSNKNVASQETPSAVTTASKLSVIPGNLAPPPPPPPGAAVTSVTTPIGPRLPDSVLLNTRPPPPPPPPGFLPPQLRHRPPIPPMPPRCPMPPHMMQPGSGMMPPRGHPMGMPPGMGPPRHHPGMMPPPPMPLHMMGGGPPPMFPGGPLPMSMPLIRPNPPSSAPSFSFSRPPMMMSSAPQRPAPTPPKIVYAAAPVRRITTETTGCLGSTTTTTTIATSSVLENATEGSGAKRSAVAAGIELNVPVEKIEAERIPSSSATAALPGCSSGAAAGADTAALSKKEKKERKRKFVRMAAGTVWEDQTLGEWDQDDFRLFCGDLGNEVTDETLARAFNKYPTFQKARVIRDKKSNKTKGFGFVSFKDPNDFTRAMREMNGKYVGNRPIKLRKSNWRERQIDLVKRKDKEKKRLGFK